MSAHDTMTTHKIKVDAIFLSMTVYKIYSQRAELNACT